MSRAFDSAQRRRCGMNRKNHDVEKQRYWQRTIGDAARSGMSIREFCRQRRLKESQFYWWQRKLKASGKERSRSVVQDKAASFALVSEDGLEAHSYDVGSRKVPNQGCCGDARSRQRHNNSERLCPCFAG